MRRASAHAVRTAEVACLKAGSTRCGGVRRQWRWKKRLASVAAICVRFKRQFPWEYSSLKKGEHHDAENRTRIQLKD
ncbi:hypothetical protein NPIL_151661 [Nephila pilipes]|uniref:Uncharacterized protein n=1 Tax=Nephila pilipes TaxID=299642 RepID=A0A8X6P7J8_NEPPI|nr:hypothetical protein NPIL_151661 [Nephila pilipes]